MNRKLIAAAATTCLTLGLGASAAAAAPSDRVPAGIQCQQAGIGTLQTFGILDDVARDGIEVVGLGVVPLRTVLELHREAPAAFQSGTGVTVVVPGTTDTLDATWCDGVG